VRVKKIPFGFLVQIRIREKVGNFASQPMSGWVSVPKKGYAEKVGVLFFWRGAYVQFVIVFLKPFFIHPFPQKDFGWFPKS